MILAAAMLCYVNCTEISKTPADEVTAQCMADRAALVDQVAALKARIAELEKPKPVAQTKKPRKRVCFKGYYLTSTNKCRRRK